MPRTEKTARTHERLHGAVERPAGSPRGFGLLFAVVAALIGLWPLLGGGSPRWALLAIGGALAAIAWLAPHWLAGPNRLWLGLGVVLQRIVSPVMMAVIYFGVITPTGLVMRLTGHDPLRLRRDADAASYWIERTPPGPSAGSMADQF